MSSERVHSCVGIFLFCVMAHLASPADALASRRVWVNFSSMKELYGTDIGVTSARIPSAVGGGPSQIIVDDFEVRQPTRIDRLVFFVGKSGSPQFLGADFYIWDSYGNNLRGNPPWGAPLVSEPNANATLTPMMQTNAAGDPVYRVNVHPNQPVLLQPGRYFIGYRVLMTYTGDKYYVLLTESNPIRAVDTSFFNFMVDEWGNTAAPWWTLTPVPGFPVQNTFYFGRGIEGAFGLLEF